MDSVRVVTTLHEDGYNLYGHDYIKTWIKYFPAEWKISYYAENHTPDFDNRIEVLDFNKRCCAWNDFYKHIQDCVNGLTDKKSLNRYRKALRWSFKMYTLLDALNTAEERFVIWLDSDVYAKRSPGNNWIQSVLQNKCIAGQMERAKGFSHVETGIILIDTEHKDINKVRSWIHRGYVEKQILNEAKPWDGIWIAKLFESKTVEVRQIQILTQRNTAKPFSDTSMSWLAHQVGDNKFPDDYSGRSGRISSSELI